MIKKIFEYLVFSGLSAIIGFITVMYMTKHMSIENFGIVGLFMAILYILPQLISFSCSGLVSINKVKLNIKEFQLFSDSYFTFGIFIFIVIFLLGLLIGLFFKQYLLLGVLLPIVAFLQFLNTFHYAELIQDGKSKRYGIYRLILVSFSFLLTVVFLNNRQLTWEARLYAIVLSEGLLLVIALRLSFYTLRHFKVSINKENVREYFIFGFPLMFGLLAGWLLNQSDRFIVLHFFSLKDVGIYTLAYSIGTIVNMINQATTNAIIPSIYKYLEEKKASKYIRKLNIFYSISILSIAILIGLSSYWFVPLFFGIEYKHATEIILFIAVAFAFNGIYRTTGSVIAYYKRNSLQMKLLYGSAGINIVFSMLLIPVFGILAPAIATVMAYTFLAWSNYYFGWEILKKEELC